MYIHRVRRRLQTHIQIVSGAKPNNYGRPNSQGKCQLRPLTGALMPWIRVGLVCARKKEQCVTRSAHLSLKAKPPEVGSHSRTGCCVSRQSQMMVGWCEVVTAFSDSRQHSKRSRDCFQSSANEKQRVWRVFLKPFKTLPSCFKTFVALQPAMSCFQPLFQKALDTTSRVAEKVFGVPTSALLGRGPK